MSTSKSNELSYLLYTHFLRLYPREFRDEFGRSMLQLFADQCRSVRRERGTRGMISLWFRTLVDTARGVLREHLALPREEWGLMEGVPNKPLPWRGVGLVLIPCLVFLVGQLGQLAGLDWFFLLARRAAFFLIIPVFVVWLFVRKLPIWGLIPIGLFYVTAFDLGYRLQYVRTETVASIGGTAAAAVWISFLEFEKSHSKGIMVFFCLLMLFAVGYLILWFARRKVMTRGAKFFLTVLVGQIVIVSLSSLFYYLKSIEWEIQEIARSQNLANRLFDYISGTMYYNFTSTISFLLLILAGAILARRFGRLAVLLPLGYIIPTVAFGRPPLSDRPDVLHFVTLAVLAYRITVTLIAPVWIVRSATDGTQKRSMTVALTAAIGILVVSHLGYFISYLSDYWWNISILDIYYYLSPELIALAGLGLAITLYGEVAKRRSTMSQPLTEVALIRG